MDYVSRMFECKKVINGIRINKPDPWLAKLAK